MQQKRITHIALDMDGVLCNFRKRYNELFNDEPRTDYNSGLEYKKDVYKQNFDKFVNDEEFINLEPMSDMRYGLSYIEQLKTKHNLSVWILSSTVNEQYYQSISKQKKKWLEMYDIPYGGVYVMGKNKKRYHTKPGRILIDDTLQNVNEWESGGGVGIHHKDWNSTIKVLESLFM